MLQKRQGRLDSAVVFKNEVLTLVLEILVSLASRANGVRDIVLNCSRVNLSTGEDSKNGSGTLSQLTGESWPGRMQESCQAWTVLRAFPDMSAAYCYAAVILERIAVDCAESLD